MADQVKLVCISDTHMAEPSLPEGDYLIHAGDMTFRGRFHEISQQLFWLSKQVPKYKAVIVIPGNHDWGFEKDPGHYLTMAKNYGIIVLNDNEFVHDGIKFYGSPITPTFHNWAFNRDRGEDIKLYWDMIPNDVDVLITHGPPLNILDGVPHFVKGAIIGHDNHYRPIYDKKQLTYEHVGCADLLERVKEVKPTVHIFGHIHDAHGQHTEHGIDFINASIMDEDYSSANKPIVYTLTKRKTT